MKIKKISINTVWLCIFAILTLNTNIAQSQFLDQSDIPQWADTAVESLIEKNIINGNDDGTLKPNRNINRAEFLKILVAATTVEIVPQSDTNFPDVNTNDWFAPYIHTAVNLGWANGYPDGTFKPGDPINRAEIAKLLTEAFNLSNEAQSTDGHWFERFTRALNEAQALPYQTPITNFSAATEPSRIEVFEQLYRLLPSQTLSTTNTPPAALTEPTEPVTLPTGQKVLTPASNDEKYLTFTPTAPTTPTITPTEVNVSSLSKGTKQSSQTNQDNVKLLELKIEGTNTLNGLQIRRIGNGKFTDFSQVWAESNGLILTEKVAPQSDFVFLEMTSPVTIEAQQNISIKARISTEAQIGNTSRWVLFLPDWIDSNALAKIGLFPLGGVDITIK